MRLHGGVALPRGHPTHDVIPAKAGIHAVGYPQHWCSRRTTDMGSGLRRNDPVGVEGLAFPCLSCAMGKVFIVYIMASMKGGTLYTGVTGNPAGRVWQHKNHVDPKSFTARYKVERLVWYEVHEDPMSAIQREKRIKDWHRDWKDRLIEEKNPTWRDLSHEVGL